MSDATLTADGDGRWVLGGALDFATVPVVWPAIERILAAGRPVSLSLRGVEHANSAGLALLVEALDVARKHGIELNLTDLPPALVDLARMSRCDGLLGAQAA